MELLPTPAPPSTTSLILSRSAMFFDRSHPGDLEHDRENVAASGRHHPGGGRSESRPPPGNPIRSPYPSRYPRPSRFSYFVQRILIWFPAAIPDRGQERVDGGSIPRDRSVAIDVAPKRSRFSTQRRRTSPTSPFTYPAYVALSRELPSSSGKSQPFARSARFELKLLLKHEKLFYYYLFTRAEYGISSAWSNYETGVSWCKAIWGRQVDWKLK